MLSICQQGIHVKRLGFNALAAGGRNFFPASGGTILADTFTGAIFYPTVVLEDPVARKEENLHDGLTR
jgi:hypothetical protein